MWSLRKRHGQGSRWNQFPGDQRPELTAETEIGTALQAAEPSDGALVVQFVTTIEKIEHFGFVLPKSGRYYF
jgi:hypothetical protein